MRSVTSWKASAARPPSGARCAFTLVELLLVVAILATLLSMLFPVFSLAREKARQTSCASNLRQIGLAIQQYRADYDDFLPRVASDAQRYDPENATSPDLASWLQMPTAHEVLQPYCSSQEIFRCPSDSLPFSAFRPDRTPYMAPNRYEAYAESYLFDLKAEPSLKTGGGAVQDDPSPLALDYIFPFHSFGRASYWELRGNALYRDGHVAFRYASQSD